MRAQDGPVHGIAVKTLGGIKLERVFDAQHVFRTDLGHHIGRDQNHDLVQALLSADLLRHGFAEPSQQDAGTSRCAPHTLNSSSVNPARRVAGTGIEPKKNNNFIHSAPPELAMPAESASPKLSHSLGIPPLRPYSESRLVFPSKNPATCGNRP